ncbi:MAG: hypothetical protein K2P07_06540, partial [Lachnospiraceae bacterium]|nr:hypothetical protein [Lachnospiraceae bacterium]
SKTNRGSVSPSHLGNVDAVTSNFLFRSILTPQKTPNTPYPTIPTIEYFASGVKSLLIPNLY